MPSPFDQSHYQVRVEWGAEGLARLAPADVVVVVDVLRFSSTLANLVAEGRSVELADARIWSSNGADVATAAAETGAIVLVGGIRNAAATYAKAIGVSEDQALDRIWMGLDAERNAPTEDDALPPPVVVARKDD